MPLITVTSLQPMIQQTFDRNLLMDFLDRAKMRLKEKIKPLAQKKLREIDIGRKREFVILLMRFEKAYERKKIEKADYEAACQEKAKERPYIPTSSGVCRFRRMDPEK